MSDLILYFEESTSTSWGQRQGFSIYNLLKRKFKKEGNHIRARKLFILLSYSYIINLAILDVILLDFRLIVVVLSCIYIPT